KSMRLPAWSKSFGVQVTIALIAGVILGLIARSWGPISQAQDNWLGTTLDTIGSSYVTLLKAAVVPLVITAIIASIGNLRKVTNAARLAVSPLLWFALTALIAVPIGLVLGVVIQPGNHADAASLSTSAPDSQGSWIGFLTGLVPVNFLGLEVATAADESGGLRSEVDFNILQLIIVSGAIGIAAVKVGKAAEPFLEFTEAALAVVQKVVWWIVRIAPIGTLGLIGNAVNSYGWSTMGSLLWFVVAVYLGLAIVFLGVYRGLARRADGLRLPFIDRHDAGDPEGRDRQLRSPAELCGIRRALRRDDEDGWLRRDLSGHRRRVRRPVLRRRSLAHPVPAHRLRR